jgi:acetyl-CoA synthetase
MSIETSETRPNTPFMNVPEEPLSRDRASRTTMRTPEAFREYLRHSKKHSDAFWGEIASEFEWIRRWDVVRKGRLPDFEYFSGGIMNPCVNLVDRHVAGGAGNRVALIWEAETGESCFLTYRMLLDEVQRFANVLKGLGVSRGDAVAIYLPNVVECLVAILACFRIGAVYNTVFSGFSANALNDRLVAFSPKVIVTADHGIRRGKRIPLKAKVDQCVGNLHSACRVIVVRRTEEPVDMVSGRDLWWHELMHSASNHCQPEPIEANEPGLVFYTSGTTGKPKGVVHSGAGFIINNYVHAKFEMDHRPDDVLWCTADIGWLTMHIWGIAGALTNGITTVFAEGALDHPEDDRFFRIVHKYRVNKLFTSPSAVRMLMRCSQGWRDRYDVSQLEVAGLVGEPLNGEAWDWLRNELGRRNLYVNNTWGQTELGGCPLAGAAWLTPMKRCSCGIENLGDSVDIVDDDGRSVPAGIPGNLVVKQPFPMMIRTLWKDHERYLNEYFRRIPGCYFTYDAAIRDVDGHYWVLGRLDDVINVAGHRLSTMEIENAVMTCSEISEAAVVDCPEPIKGAVPAAFLRLRSNQFDPGSLKSSILKAVETQIGKIAIPEHIYVVDAMPKTSSGKIMRRLLRDLLSTGEVRGDVSSLEDASSLDAVKQAVRHKL